LADSTRQLIIKAMLDNQASPDLEKIKTEIEGIKGISSVGSIFDEFTHSTNAAKEAAGGLNEIVTSLAHSMGLFAVGLSSTAAFGKFIEMGLEYNKVMAQGTLAIGAMASAQMIFTDSSGHQIQGMEKLNAAMGMSREIMEKLRQDTLKTSITFQESLQIFERTSGLLLAKGMTPQQAEQLTVGMIQAAGPMGRTEMVPMELRMAMMGRIDPRYSPVSMAIGLDAGTIRSMRGDADKLFDYIMGKLATFKDAGKLQEQSWKGLATNVKDAIEEIAGAATKDTVFEPLKNAMREILGMLRVTDEHGDQIINPEVVNTAKNLMEIFSGILQIAGGIGEALIAGLGGAAKLVEDLHTKFKDWLEITIRTHQEMSHLEGNKGESSGGLLDWFEKNIDLKLGGDPLDVFGLRIPEKIAPTGKDDAIQRVKTLAEEYNKVFAKSQQEQANNAELNWAAAGQGAVGPSSNNLQQYARDLAGIGKSATDLAVQAGALKLTREEMAELIGTLKTMGPAGEDAIKVLQAIKPSTEGVEGATRPVIKAISEVTARLAEINGQFGGGIHGLELEHFVEQWEKDNVKLAQEIDKTQRELTKIRSGVPVPEAKEQAAYESEVAKRAKELRTLEEALGRLEKFKTDPVLLQLAGITPPDRSLDFTAGIPKATRSYGPVVPDAQVDQIRKARAAIADSISKEGEKHETTEATRMLERSIPLEDMKKRLEQMVRLYQAAYSEIYKIGMDFNTKLAETAGATGLVQQYKLEEQIQQQNTSMASRTLEQLRTLAQLRKDIGEGKIFGQSAESAGLINLDPFTGRATGGPSSISIPSGSVGAQNNNPMNLEYRGQEGATQAGRWAAFATPEAGYDAALKKIQSYQDKQLTLEKMISTAAPPNENDTEGYIKYMESALGVGRNTNTASLSTQAITNAMIKKETGASITGGVGVNTAHPVFVVNFNDLINALKSGAPSQEGFAQNLYTKIPGAPGQSTTMAGPSIAQNMANAQHSGTAATQSVLNDLQTGKIIGENCGDAAAKAINAGLKAQGGTSFLPGGGLGPQNMVDLAKAYNAPLMGTTTNPITLQSLLSSGVGTLIRMTRQPGDKNYEYGTSHAETIGMNPEGQLSVGSYTAGKGLRWKELNQQYVDELPTQTLAVNPLGQSTAKTSNADELIADYQNVLERFKEGRVTFEELTRVLNDVVLAGKGVGTAKLNQLFVDTAKAVVELQKPMQDELNRLHNLQREFQRAVELPAGTAKQQIDLAQLSAELIKLSGSAQQAAQAQAELARIQAQTSMLQAANAHASGDRVIAETAIALAQGKTTQAALDETKAQVALGTALADAKAKVDAMKAALAAVSSSTDFGTAFKAAATQMGQELDKTLTQTIHDTMQNFVQSLEGFVTALESINTKAGHVDRQIRQAAANMFRNMETGLTKQLMDKAFGSLFEGAGFSTQQLMNISARIVNGQVSGVPGTGGIPGG
jgi:hypothetical protein